MITPEITQQNDHETAYQCAFSLPAVALTLGRKNWQCLKQAYETLASDMKWNIRKTVASSLHELANILGSEIATRDLVPIFEAFIKDLDEVRIGVLKHMANFFQSIRHTGRAALLPSLKEFLKTDNSSNWRFKEELAEQLISSVELFTPEECDKHIKILALELLTDKVKAVRDTAIDLVTALVGHFSSDTALVSTLLILLVEQFAHSPHWSRRQTYAKLCGHFVTAGAVPMLQVELEILTHLLDLSRDRVPNVRLSTVRVLVEIILKNEYFINPLCNAFDDIQKVVRHLQTDSDRDVRFFANESRVEEQKETEVSLSDTLPIGECTLNESFSTCLNVKDAVDVENTESQKDMSDSSIITSDNSPSINVQDGGDWNNVNTVDDLKDVVQ